MQYSWLPQEARQVKIREKPPLVISQQRYARLQANANQNAKQEQLQRQQRLRQQYEEQLRVGGEELMSRFGRLHMCPIDQEQQYKSEVLKQQHEQQLAKERALEESIALQREQKLRQRERIEKAQQLLEKLRPGPRELHCAKLQSEVLRGINAQRHLQAQLNAASEQQRSMDRRVYSEQVFNGLEEAHSLQQQRHQQLAEHKRDLLKAIEQRQQERSAHKAEQLEMAREEQERYHLQLKLQLEKEEAEQKAKTQQRRQHALASLEAAEHRRQEEKLLDKVELALSHFQNEVKSQVDNLKVELAQQREQQRLQRIEQLAEQQAQRLHHSAGEDQPRNERQLYEMRRAHSVQQQRRRQRRELAKANCQAIQRSEQQLTEAAKQHAKAEQARRLRNEQIHVRFKQQQREQRLQRQRELRAQLDKQKQERRDAEATPETNYNRLAQLECLREDARFMDYAYRLIVEARDKGCPLRPFLRVLDQYKSLNRIGAEVRVPRHLITKLTMGRRTKGDSLALDTKIQEGPTEEEEYKESIRESLKKIQELVLAEAKQKDEQSKADQIAGRNGIQPPIG